MKLFLKNFVWLYLILVLVDLTFGIKQLSEYRVLSKPLILFSLLVYYILKAKNNVGKTFYLTVSAIFFSLLGDIFLLFDEISSLYFTLGLASFLIAHLLYTLVFIEKSNLKIPLALKWIALFFIAYGIALFFTLRSNLGNLQTPVILYIIGILAMVISALFRKNNVPESSFIKVLTGAILFVISDSFLAVNKFLVELPLSHILVMGTYAAAQIFIARGILKQGDFDN